MRTFLTTLALISSLCVAAQDYGDPAYAVSGRELPRSETIAYPTQAEAAAGAAASKFLVPLKWEKSQTARGTRFTASYTVPFAWANRQVLFRLASAPGAYELKANDRIVGYSQNGSLPAEFNLTKASREGKNELTVTVLDNPASTPLESWDHGTDRTLGSAFVMSQPTIRLRDIFTRTREAEVGFTAEVGMVVKTDALNPKTARIHYELRDTTGRVVKSGFQDITLSMRKEDTLRFVTSIPKDMLWSPESPVTYKLIVKTQIEGRYAEYLAFQTGFRPVVNNDGKLVVNGTPRELRMAEIKPDLPVSELARLKSEGVNTLRTRAGIVRDGFYDDCDSIGLFVIAQAPINTSAAGSSIRRDGNPSNRPEWTNAYTDRTLAAYYIARRHPSVIAFSLAEDSANGINLYESYLRLKAIEPDLPILYPAAAGQWNSDTVLTINKW